MDKFRQQGLGVCVITYDSVDILADFAKRKSITIPMLSDPGSKVIREFGILNTSVASDSMQYGIPYPGTYIVNRDGIVQSKYFEDLYSDRYSAPTILLREFGSAAGTRQTEVKTDHVALKYYATTDVVHPNLRLTLVADFNLKPKMHVYAPGVQGYIPINFEVAPSPNFVAQPVKYPKSENLFLPVIKETVPVFQGKFRVTQDITMAADKALQSVLSGSREVKITGKLRYQACDDKECYLPQTIPLEWMMKVEPLDRERVPEPIQHKAPAGAK
ncbi:MAG: redoxin domain-containing protein [Acidobacteria bacterium]|nr:redoxin domain-containing protein [Acidobacteriota bacterium]